MSKKTIKGRIDHGAWKVPEMPIKPRAMLDAGVALRSPTPDQRMEVFQQFCTHCGSSDPRCQCWNDE